MALFNLQMLVQFVCYFGDFDNKNSIDKVTFSCIGVNIGRQAKTAHNFTESTFTTKKNHMFSHLV